MRLTPDAPRVEERSSAIAVLAHHLAEPEYVRPLEKEGPLLGKRGLECAQVDDRRVHFDLPEIRIDRCAQGQPARQAVLEIRSGGRPGVVGLVEWIQDVPGRARELRAHVRHELDALRRGEVDQSAELSEPRDERPVLRRPRRPRVTFIAPRDIALHLDAPQPLGARDLLAVPELAQRNAVFRDPAKAVNARGDFPHGIPVQVLLAVIVHIDVLLDAAGRRGEAKRRAPVVV